MNTLNAALQHQEPAIARAVVYRTRGHAHGPVTRLMSPSDLGEILKPFVFLDRIDIAEPSSRKVESFGLHPHSGIATLTWLFEGYANYEDNMGRRGKLTQRSMEWMHAGRGAWHGGSFGDSDRLRGFQLWIALPAASELGPAYSTYAGPQQLSTDGPVTVLLGQYGKVKSPIEAPAPINYYAVTLKAGERWTFTPTPGHTVDWAAVSAGKLRSQQTMDAGELVVFEQGEKPVHFLALDDAEFVVGSAVKHPHDLKLGHYSVHTSEQALQQGEAWIQELGHGLRAQGRL